VASEAGAEAAMPVVDLFWVKGTCTAATQFTRVFGALLSALLRSKRGCAVLVASYHEL
jgi:hypothetical protein